MNDEYTPTERDLIGTWVEAFEAAGSELSPHELDIEARRGITRIQANAWDEGYEGAARYHDLDTEHAAPNPYRRDETDE